MIRSVYLLPYYLNLPYLYQLGMCCLILTSFSWSDDILRQVFRIGSVSILPCNLDWPYLVHTLMMVGICQEDMCHLIFTSFSKSTDFVKSFHVQNFRSVSPYCHTTLIYFIFWQNSHTTCRGRQDINLCLHLLVSVCDFKSYWLLNQFKILNG